MAAMRGRRVHGREANPMWRPADGRRASHRLAVHTPEPRQSRTERMTLGVRRHLTISSSWLELTLPARGTGS